MQTPPMVDRSSDSLASENLNDMDTVVDDVSDFEVSTDSLLFFPFQGESHIIGLQVGA